MNKIFTLTKFFVLSSLKEKIGDEKNKAFIIASYIITFLILIVSSLVSVNNLYISLYKINLETLIVPLMLILNFTLCIFYGIFKILSRFCFANDSEFLLELPLTIEEVFLSKLLAIEIELLPISFLFIPSLFTYGILSKASFSFYIYAILSALVIPIIPILYGTIISLFITRFTLKNKFLSFFKNFYFALVFLLIILIFSALFDSSNFIKLITSLSKNPYNHSLGFIDIIFPINIFLIKALLFSNSLISLKYIAFIFLFIFIALFITVLLCKRLYLKIMLTYKDDEGTVFINKKMDFKSSNSILITLVKRDFSILIKNPQFFLYTFGYFGLGIFMIAFFVAIFSKEGVTIDDLKNKTTFLFYSLSFFSHLLVTINSASYTSLSREGEYFYILKQMPIPKKTLLKSKIVTSLLVNTVVIIVDLIILILLSPKLHVFIALLLSQLSLITFYIVSSIYTDTKNPTFKWSNEKDLMQNSIGKLFKPLLFFYLFVALVLTLSFTLSSLKVPNAYALLVICYTTIGIHIALIFIYYKKTLNKLDTLYNC